VLKKLIVEPQSAAHLSKRKTDDRTGLAGKVEAARPFA